MTLPRPCAAGPTASSVLTLDEVYELPLEAACKDLEVGEELLTMVVLNLEGELGGSMVLTFKEADGRQLAASLLQAELRRRPRMERTGDDRCWPRPETSSAAPT